MKWHATFAVPFGTCDFDAVQATRRHDLDADSAQTHCILHRALHCTTEHDALFELLRDRIGDQLRIDLRLADLFDIDVHWHAHDLRQRRLQHFDVFAFFTDHDTRTRRVNGEARVLGRTLDDDATDRSVLQLLFQESACFQVFQQHGCEVAVTSIPTRRPVTGDRQAEAGWVDFLTHSVTP